MSSTRLPSAEPSRSGSAFSVSNGITPSSPGWNSSTLATLPDGLRAGVAARSRLIRRIGRPMAHRVTLIPGDGTGPELTEATVRVLEATGVEFEWDVQPAGAGVMEAYGGNPLPEQTLESIRRNGVALK